MRLSACTGGLLLAASACAGLPESIRIDVDGRIIEVRQQGMSAALLGGDWSVSAQCADGLAEEVEVTASDGERLKLYRCPR